jgi:Uma2 family endonuclease
MWELTTRQRVEPGTVVPVMDRDDFTAREVFIPCRTIANRSNTGYNTGMSDPLPSLHEDSRFTYADYLEWEGPERYEIINGEAFLMASPTVEHQAMITELLVQLANFLRGKPCKVFAAPLDVRLFPEEDYSDDTVVQPDILVVCDASKLSKGSVDGPPDLVVEILSPSNTRKQMFLKFESYLNAGVREYWVLDPEEKKAQVHILQEGRYISSVYKKDAVIPVSVLPPLSLDLATLWETREETPRGPDA